MARAAAGVGTGRARAGPTRTPRSDADAMVTDIATLVRLGARLQPGCSGRRSVRWARPRPRSFSTGSARSRRPSPRSTAWSRRCSARRGRHDCDLAIARQARAPGRGPRRARRTAAVTAPGSQPAHARCSSAADSTLPRRHRAWSLQPNIHHSTSRRPLDKQCSNWGIPLHSYSGWQPVFHSDSHRPMFLSANQMSLQPPAVMSPPR